MGKILKFILVIFLIILPIFLYFKYLYVFGEGVKAGELNQFMLKGYMFKTYEGRMIQSGFKGNAAVFGNEQSLGSYIFEFSVKDKALADSLMNCSGKTIKLHYKEYLGALPWRGVEKKIVDRIISVNE